MRASKKLLLGLAVLAVSVTGIQAEEECEVCVRDPLGLSEECWDVRLDHELRLLFAKEEYVIRGESTNRWIKVSHIGARLQWSTNSVDWDLFNHCRGVGIQPNLSSFTFNHKVGFAIGHPIDLHYIGELNWEKSVYEGPEVFKFFIRLLPCDVNAHKEAYKNRKISLSKISVSGHPKRLRIKWNYGRLQFTKSLSQDGVEWEDRGGFLSNKSAYVYPQEYLSNEEGHRKYGFGAFFRIKPINEDAFKVFYIDLDEDIIREEKLVSDIPVLAHPLDLK